MPSRQHGALENEIAGTVSASAADARAAVPVWNTPGNVPFQYRHRESRVNGDQRRQRGGHGQPPQGDAVLHRGHNTIPSLQNALIIECLHIVIYTRLATYYSFAMTLRASFSRCFT